MKRLISNELKSIKKCRGRNLENLQEGRGVKERFLNEFEMIPHSILLHNRQYGRRTLDIVVNDRGGAYEPFKRIDRKKVTELTGIHSLAKTGCELHSIKRNKTLSAFSQNIGQLIVRFYCPKGGMVYDPFAGHNSRMQLVVETGRSYTGVDVSSEFMEANRKIRNILIKKQENKLIKMNDFTIDLIEGSSHDVDLPDAFADFTITSPPYWDTEYYGNEKEQLGNAKSYVEFLDMLLRHIVENFRLLKPGAFCSWFVNDFRKNGIFYPYHADVYRLLCDAGFDPFTIYIVDLGQPINAAFVRNIIKTKLFPKRHEYCLMVRKPGEDI